MASEGVQGFSLENFRQNHSHWKISDKKIQFPQQRECEFLKIQECFLMF